MTHKHGATQMLQRKAAAQKNSSTGQWHCTVAGACIKKHRYLVSSATPSLYDAAVAAVLSISSCRTWYGMLTPEMLPSMPVTCAQQLLLLLLLLLLQWLQQLFAGVDVAIGAAPIPAEAIARLSRSEDLRFLSQQALQQHVNFSCNIAGRPTFCRDNVFEATYANRMQAVKALLKTRGTLCRWRWQWIQTQVSAGLHHACARANESCFCLPVRPQSECHFLASCHSFMRHYGT